MKLLNTALCHRYVVGKRLQSVSQNKCQSPNGRALRKLPKIRRVYHLFKNHTHEMYRKMESYLKNKHYWWKYAKGDWRLGDSELHYCLSLEWRQWLQNIYFLIMRKIRTMHNHAVVFGWLSSQEFCNLKYIWSFFFPEESNFILIRRWWMNKVLQTIL